MSRADVKEAAALLLGGAGPVSAPQEAAAGHSSAAESGASEVGRARECVMVGCCGCIRSHEVEEDADARGKDRADAKAEDLEADEAAQ